MVRWHFVTRMSEEKCISLNVKRLPSNSTPAELSMLPQNSTRNLFPMSNKSFEFIPSFEELPWQPQTQSSLDLLQGRLPVMSFPCKEPGSSSQFAFLRRRLSTITGSEGSPGELDQTAIFPTSAVKRTRDPEELPGKSKDATAEQGCKVQDATPFKKSAVKRRGKGVPDNQLVENRVREWELHQLKNIEEATTHELTIEDI